MVSTGPDVQNYNFTHMYSFVDRRLNDREEVYLPNKDTLYSYICNPEFSKFKKILEKAKMISQLNNIQANFTVFVPDDDSLKDIPDEYFSNMDIGTAKQIVNASIIVKKINGELIQSSPVAYYYTLNPKMRMYITNIGGITIINNRTRITEYDITLTNGIIHKISDLIIPNEDHFMN